MTLNKLVLHRLDKEQHGSTDTTLSESLLEVGDDATEFVESFQSRYADRSTIFGKFEEEDRRHSSSFEGKLREYWGSGGGKEESEKKRSDESFLSFTHEAMGRFETVIKSVQLATGGYVAFGQFEDPSPFVFCVMLGNTSSIAASEEATEDGVSITLETLEHLDIEHMQVASRINIDKWTSEDEEDRAACLSFVSGKNKVSKYFRTFIGCTERKSPAAQTRAARKATNDYMEENDYLEEDKREIRQELALYGEDCDRKKEPMLLNRIAVIVDEEDPEAFKQFASQPDYGVSEQFSPSRNELKDLRYVRYENNEEGWDLKFKPKLLEEGRFRYEDKTKDLIIQDIPERLADAIREHTS